MAVLSWVALVLYVAMALFAVSQGYLEVSSLIGVRRSRVLRPAYYDDVELVEDEVPVTYAEEEYYDDSPYEEAPVYDTWRREPRRVALG